MIGVLHAGQKMYRPIAHPALVMITTMRVQRMSRGAVIHTPG